MNRKFTFPRRFGVTLRPWPENHLRIVGPPVSDQAKSGGDVNTSPEAGEPDWVPLHIFIATRDEVVNGRAAGCL
jgi:hypothetical protein